MNGEKGSFIVKVEDAIVMDVTSVEQTAELAPALLARGHDVYEVTYNSSQLHGTESVHVTPQMINAFVEVMYMTQRCSDTETWNNLPEATASVYDALTYTQAKIRSDEGREAYTAELEEMNQRERFVSEKPDNLE